MLICGIYFGEKTIWDEISENIKAAELEMDKAFDRIKEELEVDEEPDELDMLVESLLNYKDVLEGKVRDLEESHKKLKEALGISGQQKEELMNIIGENNTEIEKLHVEIERQDEEIEGLQMRNSSNVTEFKKLNCKINKIRARCREEARDLFDKGEWGMIEICGVGEKKECDCGNMKKRIEELQSEVRDLAAENVKLVTMNNHLKNAIHIKEQGNIIADKSYEELKEKYETADLEREHLKTELDKIKRTKKELESALMATIGTVQRLSAELAKTGKE